MCMCVKVSAGCAPDKSQMAFEDKVTYTYFTAVVNCNTIIESLSIALSMMQVYF